MLDSKTLMTISSSKESTDSPRRDVAIEIWKISQLDNHNQTLQDVGDHVYDALERFCQNNKYNDRLLLMSLNIVRKEKDELRG